MDPLARAALKFVNRYRSIHAALPPLDALPPTRGALNPIEVALEPVIHNLCPLVPVSVRHNMIRYWTRDGILHVGELPDQVRLWLRDRGHNSP